MVLRIRQSQFESELEDRAPQTLLRMRKDIYIYIYIYIYMYMYGYMGIYDTLLLILAFPPYA